MKTGKKMLSILLCFVTFSALFLSACGRMAGTQEAAAEAGQELAPGDAASAAEGTDDRSADATEAAASAAVQETAAAETTGTGTQEADAAVYPYETRELMAQRDGNRIYGEIYIPQGAGERMPAVIISHGFGGTHQAGVQYARALAERGYVAYCFDFCGGSPGSRSDGSTLEMSIFTEQADLEAVINMMQELDYVDRDNLFLMGTSQGGAVSAVTGATHPDEIRGMILLYPAFVMVDEANRLFDSVQDIPDTYYFMWMEVGRAYFEPLLDYDIYGAIAAYEKDVLLIHGDADSIVPLFYSEQALEAYPSAELKVIPGAGHGFHGEDADQAVDYMMEYLESHRTPAEGPQDMEALQSMEGRQVRMTSGDVEVLITLNDSQAAADFAKMLPLELTLIERNGFAKGMTLPRRLDTEEETTREYEIGDFGYWAAGPDLAIFYDDIYDQTIVPVIPMGKAEAGAENMRNTSGTVRLELVEEETP